MAVFAVVGGWALATEGPHIRLAAPQTSSRARTLAVSGATTSQFPDVRVYLEHRSTSGAACAATPAAKPRRAQEWGWNDVVPDHAVDLVSFERKEHAIAVYYTGTLYLVCGYLVNRAGHVGARTRLQYRDPATH